MELRVTEETPASSRPTRGRRIFNAGGNVVQWVAVVLLAVGFLAMVVPN